jgi:hypothetical protein
LDGEQSPLRDPTLLSAWAEDAGGLLTRDKAVLVLEECIQLGHVLDRHVVPTDTTRSVCVDNRYSVFNAHRSRGMGWLEWMEGEGLRRIVKGRTVVG